MARKKNILYGAKHDAVYGVKVGRKFVTKKIIFKNNTALAVGAWEDDQLMDGDKDLEIPTFLFHDKHPDLNHILENSTLLKKLCNEKAGRETTHEWTLREENDGSQFVLCNMGAVGFAVYRHEHF